jgi:hypothetical protein
MLALLHGYEKRRRKEKSQMNLNDFFNRLTNFKMRFTNNIEAEIREIQVSNMPLKFLVHSKQGDFIAKFLNIDLGYNETIISLREVD